MIISWLAIGLLLCFGAVLLVGPPYLPTMHRQIEAALDMLDLKPGQTLIELGCGDGVVLVAAAKRGLQVTGIELNPLLVLVCRLRTWRYRKQVNVVMGNYWNVKLWPPADGMFGFVLPKYMAKLDETITAWQRATRQGQADFRLASFAFQIPGKTIAKQQSGVFLYIYK